MLVHKPKQYLKQQTGFYLSQKFWNDSLKIQSWQVNVVKQFYAPCSRMEKANWPGIVQRPVNAGLHKLGLKTARPSVG